MGPIHRPRPDRAISVSIITALRDALFSSGDILLPRLQPVNRSMGFESKIQFVLEILVFGRGGGNGSY